ncbi:Ig-like domain-containing protein [Tengunoibacter tsumagoiensis]|uniref:Uncharacterized protein n=1 Tax=Tengunoibacter tsumagoiensis TaxID=2014871 RepID=A0A402A5G0_9CHLR|nr:Ig-like domain-containing protein [Tengunoibacter tsumagoiensis]GCE14201.1 hypothetical protein KTT_40600 [Tengunoibacter tsumagoiensis]GCE14255.1 hypothetical protein KTT_41140 [Tengunoibacter tsumagoiensis]
MGTAAKGTLGLVLENINNPGPQLLYNGAVSASFSLTTQPSGSTGMRLYILVQGNTTTGTVTITGTGVGGGTPTETTPTIPIQAAGQAVQVNDYEYVSTNVYATVNANGITTTGLANAKIMIYGVQAAKYLIPCIADIEDPFGYFSPQEARGLLDRDTRSLQTIKKPTINKIDQALYPEASMFAAYAGVSNNPAVVSIPASPTSLKTSSAISGGPFSLTTQPTAPGMVLIFTVTSSSATGTIVVSGTNQWGVAVSETITAAAGGSNGNGTYYSTNVYSAVNASGVAFTGLTSGSCAITGVYGWQYTFTPDLNALYSACLEWYSGTDSNVIPQTYLTDLEFAFNVEKETSLSVKGGTWDVLPIGNRSTNPLSASLVSSLAQPQDLPMVGWQTAIYIDSLGGTPATTAYSSVVEGKVSIKVPQKPIYTATVTQNFNRLYRQQREVMLTAKIDFASLDQFEAYRTNLKQFLAFQFLGGYIGSVAGTIYSKSWTWIFPAQYVKFKRDATKLDNVQADLEAKGIYEISKGYSHQLVIVSQQPPNYTA